MADDKDVKTDEKSKKKNSKNFDSSKYIDVEPTLDEKEETNEALLTRMQRRARGITMRKNRFKIKRGREKAARRMASVEILKKRARKQAIRNLKAKFAKNKRYAEMSAGEKIVIDKRISKLPASRLNAMARKLLPSVKTAERARKTHAKKESVSLSSMVDNNLNEATMWGQRQGKRPHMLLDKDNKPKFDKRFRMYKPKMEESVDDFDEILNLLETTEDYVSSEQGREDMQSFKENTRLKLINKIKNSGVVKTGSMSKDAPVKKEKEEIKELSIADVQKATAMAKKRQEKERNAKGKTSVSTTDLAARMPKKEAADLADLANEKIKDKKEIGEIPKDSERKFKRRKTVVDKEIEKNDVEEAATQRSLLNIVAKNEAFGRARFSQELKRKGMDVNKMHSDNVKDAEAAKKRSAEAEKDLAHFRKKHGIEESTNGVRQPKHMDPKPTSIKSITTTKRNPTKVKPKPAANNRPGYVAGDEYIGEAQLDELSPSTMQSYQKKADKQSTKSFNKATDIEFKAADKGDDVWSSDSKASNKHSKLMGTGEKRAAGARLARKKLIAKGAKSPKMSYEEVEQLDELSPETMMSYKKKADYSADRAANSATAKILRGKDKDGNRADHSPELKTMKKRREGDRLYNTRAADKLRKALRKEAIEEGIFDNIKKKANDVRRKTLGPNAAEKDAAQKAMMKRQHDSSMANIAMAMSTVAKKDKAKEVARLRKEATIPDGQTAFTKRPDVSDNDRDKLLKIKAMMDKERSKKNTNEKYASDAQRKAVWASRNDKKNEAQVDEMDISVKSITKSGLRKVGDTPKLKADLKALRARLNKDKGDGYGSNKSLKANYGEEAGAGEQGTDKLVNKFKKDTPNA